MSVTRAVALVGFLAVAQNPDPQLPLTSLSGATRTLDDWTTVFNLALVILPDRPEARAFLPVIERIFATFGDSDVRTVVCVPSTAAITRRILGDAADRWLVFVDPDATLADEPRPRAVTGVCPPSAGYVPCDGGPGVEPD